MVSQLLSPTQPKNFSDLIVLLVLGVLIISLYLLPSPWRIPTYAVIFLFWRTCYNAGIGYLLHIQSRHRRLVSWAKRSRIFDKPRPGENKRTWVYSTLKREFETKIPEDYRFEEAPVEYNTWLVFRRMVDLILMCDFVSYCLFAIACGGWPRGETTIVTLLRFLAGISLVGFNLWVKLDAHRVVKDYAWYWGDFFYLIDQELTFDGVFEMAPHPMYSVGYAGYYGISLLAASYKVLFISIIAHAAQFAFLVWVENPHIEKTYNAPPPRKQCFDLDVDREDRPMSPDGAASNYSTSANLNQPSSVHNLIGLENVDLHRVIDTAVVLLHLQMLALVVLTPSTPVYQSLFVIHAAIWRLWYSLGIGFILNRQSTRKRWTRHFLKYGDSTEEAWRQWKGLYHLSMTMCYVSFLAASWKAYRVPADWSSEMAVLKHVVGVSLVALQIWTTVSIYDSLGEFGWFFGDFFFDSSRKLKYSGIYRFLNNPERVIGLAGVWGAALITGSTAIFLLALLSHVLALVFIQFVERPHMQKLYGQTVRRESGVSKSFRRSLPSQFFEWQDNMDRMLSDTFDSFEDLVEAARPKIAAGMKTFVRDSTALFRHPTRISITRLEPDLAGYDPKDYSVEIEGTRSATIANSGQTTDFKPISFEYGAPIKVRWTAPLNHSPKDWIGLYMVADNASRDITRIASQGRWVATNRDQYDSIVADDGVISFDVRAPGGKRQDGESKDFMTGQMEFAGDKLWWKSGVFEFRYHHNGKHNVMATSLPFEITIEKFDEEDAEVDANGLLRSAVEDALLRLVRNCFDRDPEIAPSTIDEGFGGLVEKDGKYAKRVVYAMHRMFGIEFAPEIVQADGNIRNLAWRVCNAKQVLVIHPVSVCRLSTLTSDQAPYMSLSKGKGTPTQPQY